MSERLTDEQVVAIRAAFNGRGVYALGNTLFLGPDPGDPWVSLPGDVETVQALASVGRLCDALLGARGRCARTAKLAQSFQSEAISLRHKVARLRADAERERAAVVKARRLYLDIMKSLTAMRSTGRAVNPMVVWQKLEPLGQLLRGDHIDSKGGDDA